VTDEGIVAAELLVERAIGTPTVTACPVSVTVPTAAFPPHTVAGLNVTEDNPGGLTVMIEETVIPPEVAEIVDLV